MNPIILVQCRLKSKRLPYKALRPLYGVPMIVRLVERLQPMGIPICVATSTNAQDDLLCSLCEKNNRRIGYHRGHPDNLAQRFMGAGVGFNPIIRVTADNPLTDPNIMLDLLAEWKPGGLVTVADGPRGVKSDVIDVALLKNMPAEDQEHKFMHYLMAAAKDNYKICEMDGSDISLTCDTPEDYARLQRIYNFWKGQPPNLEAILEHWVEY